MSFTPLEDTFRLSSIQLCGTTPGDPIGGSIDESIGWIKSRPGTRLSPATAMDSYDLSCVGVFGRAFAPIARGTTGATVYTLLQIGAGTITITLSTMLAGAWKARMSQKPHEFEQACEYSAGDTENLAPVAVSG